MSKENEKEKDIVTHDEPENVPVEQEDLMDNIDKSKFKTIGTKLSVKGSDDAEEVKIAHLTSIGEIGLESDEIEITTHDSADDFGEFIAGKKDAGEVEITGYMFKEEDFENLMKKAVSRELCDWTVTYKSGAKWTFRAFVKSLKDGEKGLEDIASFSASLRISGKPTFVKGATV